MRYSIRCGGDKNRRLTQGRDCDGADVVVAISVFIGGSGGGHVRVGDQGGGRHVNRS